MTPAPDADEPRADAPPSSGPGVASSPSRVERHAPLVAGLLLALPTLLTFYPPMTDGALHEGMIGLLLHRGDPAYGPPGLYTLNLGHSNQLFYLLAWPLAYAVGTVWAMKIVVAAAQVLMFTGGAKLADHLGRSRWSVLLFAPLALGFTYYWGLVPNLLGFAAFFYALPVLDRFTESPTRRGGAHAAIALVALYLAHESVFTMGLAVIVGLTALQPLTLRGTIARLAPMSVGLAASLWNHTAALAKAQRGTFVAPTTYLSVTQKLALFSNVLFGAHDEIIRDLMLLLALGTVGGLVASRRSDPAFPPPPESASRFRALQLRLHAYRFEILGALLLLGYFVVPYNYGGATMLHERFVGPAWGILVVCAAPRGAVHRLAKVVAAVVPAGVLLLAWPQFVDASEAHRNLAALLDEIPKGSAVATCSLDKKGIGGRVYNLPAGVPRSLAVVGGRTGLSLLHSPIAPVQMRPDQRWNDFELRQFFYHSSGFKPAHDLTRFHYVIGQSRSPELRELITGALAPEADKIDERGEWMLFRSREKVLPIDAPETIAPAELDTVVDRVNYLAAKKRGLDVAPPPSMVKP